MGGLVALIVPISLKNAVQLIAVVCNQPYVNSIKLKIIINSMLARQWKMDQLVWVQPGE